MTNRRSMLIGSAAVFGLGSLLQAWSPGKTQPLVDDAGRPIAGSLSEQVFVQINGIRQGMIIQTRDVAHRVLLFLHGGPGMPEFFLNDTHPGGLEQDFTVVWWEQRGAGLSFSLDIPPRTMTIAQMIADTIAVADYLRDRFRQQKIILLGHSWGSFLGIQVAAAAPERFHAYIGMGQVSWQLRSEVAARSYLLDQYRAKGDIAMVRKIYEHFGMQYTPEAERRMRAFLAANAADKHGMHRYDLSFAGLDEATERKRYAAYQERFGIPSEPMS